MQSNNICELDRCDLMRIKKLEIDKTICSKMMQMIKVDQFDTLGGLIGRQHVIYDLK